MSQQKYASNVVEKCLTFGSPEERQLLVNEMLGSVDENEPLQVCSSLLHSNLIAVLFWLSKTRLPLVLKIYSLTFCFCKLEFHFDRKVSRERAS